MENNEEIVLPIHSMENFTWRLHKKIAGKTTGNFVSSALGAHVVLSMAAYGAEGNTAREMKQVLNLPENDKPILRGFQIFVKNVNNFRGVTSTMANKIYVSNNISIKDTFKELSGTYFGSTSEEIDFSNASEAASAINQWCAENTNGKITNMIDPSGLGAEMAVILLNALYFKGKWEYVFNPENTKDRPFHVSKFEEKQVPTMFVQKRFHYKFFENLNADCIYIPYQYTEMYMMIIIPREIDGLEEVEKKLASINLDPPKDEDLEKISLYLPKFKVKSKIELNDHLQELGMTEVFSDCANLRGITGTGPLKVDTVLQQAFIEVNEEGTEAAAVTGVMMVKRCMPMPPIEVKVDRPFLFRIFHLEAVTLFSGRVSDPSV